MSTASAVSRPRAPKRPGRFGAMAAALIIHGAFCAPAFAVEGAGTNVADATVSGASVSGTSVSGASVLEAADHAELRAGIAASGVVRIALDGDRIARAVRGAGRFEIEHEPANGDLYLRPPEGAGGGADRVAEASTASEAVPAAFAPAVGPRVLAPVVGPQVLFVGTEKGFTYRLTLVPVAGGPAQVLIRNRAAGASATPATTSADRRIGPLVRLVRAVARREPLAGYSIHAGGLFPGSTAIETWRGPRFSALVFEAGPSAPEGAEGAAALAGTTGGGDTRAGDTHAGDTRAGDGARLAAFWLAPSGTGPSGGRLAVAVFEDTRAADTRAGDIR